MALASQSNLGFMTPRKNRKHMVGALTGLREDGKTRTVPLAGVGVSHPAPVTIAFPLAPLIYKTEKSFIHK